MHSRGVNGWNPGWPTSGSAVPRQSDQREAELRRLEQNNVELDFAPGQRPRYQEELTGYFATGWLPQDSHRPGPVLATADAAANTNGMEPNPDHLVLDARAEVLGKRNSVGGVESYFVQLEGRYFQISIESGRDPSRPNAGSYEIFVSPPYDWETFVEELGL